MMLPCPREVRFSQHTSGASHESVFRDGLTHSRLVVWFCFCCSFRTLPGVVCFQMHELLRSKGFVRRSEAAEEGPEGASDATVVVETPSVELQVYSRGFRSNDECMVDMAC